jgi:hypothetical protein
MRDTYFLVMLAVGVLALIVFGFFLDKWVVVVAGHIYSWWMVQKWLLDSPSLLLEGAAAVGFIVYLIVEFIRDRYNPAGLNPSGTHEWVFQDTGRKFKDATEYEMYERQHGPGSWQRKVEAEKKSFVYFGGLVALAGIGGVVAWVGAHGAIPAGLWLGAFVAGLVFYILSALIFRMLDWSRDRYDFEETLTADMVQSAMTVIMLIGIYLFLFFLYALVYLFIPTPPLALSSIYLGAHGVFAVFLLGMLVLFPFLPVFVRMKGG